MPGVAVPAGKGDQHGKAADGQDRAETVGDAVGDFFTPAVAGGWMRGGCHM